MSALPVVCLASWGCHAPASLELSESARVVPCDDEAYAVLWESAKDALRGHRFRLDRTDRRDGTLTTLPEGSQHFFELWRDDVATRGDFWEATLCPIRRSVTVRFDRSSDSDECKVAVVVRKERLSAPERQINNSAAALRFFSDSLPTVQRGELLSREDGARWVDLGRDASLERRILESILTDGP